jgi:hypothetical protein
MAVTHSFNQAPPALKTIFQQIDGHSCPHRYNFHLHTQYSDGQLHPEALIQQAVGLGLSGLAITDHHTTLGYWIAQRWLEDWQQQVASAQVPNLWVGVEITALLEETEVHILGYDFNPTDRALTPYLQGQRVTDNLLAAAQVIQAIQGAGGLAVLAHPARYGRSPLELVTAAVDLGIDGLETYYCYKNQVPWQPSPDQTQLLQALGERYGLLPTCGTDTHGLDIRCRR